MHAESFDDQGLECVQLKVAVVSVHGCPCIPPGGLDAGGMNVYVRETSIKLAELGHEVTIFARGHASGQLVPLAMPKSVELVHIAVGDPELTKGKIGETLPEFTVAVGERIAERRWSFDVIAAHYWFSGLVAASLADDFSVPLVFSYHTMAATKLAARAGEDESPERLTAESEIARRADRIVAWTVEESAAIQLAHSIPTGKIVVSSPGVDCVRFTPRAEEGADSAIGSQTRGPNVGYVGRLDAFKGIDLLLEAFAQISQRDHSARLLVAGDGDADQRASFCEQVRRLGLSDSVNWLGIVPYEEMPAFYASLDVMLAPSFHETFGIAALEAAASGVPVVAADVDGLRAIVEDGATGFLIRERDPDVYASRTLEILRNDSLRHRMSRASRAKAESRSWESVARDLQEIYMGVTRR